uniref:PQ-loop repeat-containing protein 1 n=1 Tax=Meloidogyne hapla TaxID=6305 RepID=A0A1I8BT88_MELHA
MNVYFVEALGLSALLVEACLGVPQLLRNFQRKSTVGMSVKMVLMWLIGDIGKTIYFIIRASPAQFWICSCLQITIDILILLQVWVYGRKHPHAADLHNTSLPNSLEPSTTSKI